MLVDTIDTDNSTANDTDNTNNRRHFIRNMVGTVGAGALLAVAQSAAHATVGTHAGTSISGIYDVTASPYNALGNGTTDDSTAIQNAINAAQSSNGVGSGGGIVYLPAGNYYIAKPLTIAPFGTGGGGTVTLQGAGWGTPYPGANGTMLIIPNISAMTGGVSAITVTARGTTIRDIGITHTQNYPSSTSWVPLGYGPAINFQAGGDDSRLENILLCCPTIGIMTQKVGRVTMNRIFGQPLTTGITIDGAEDVIKVDNVHFWNFWTGGSASANAYAENWTYNNGTAIVSLRNDNPQFSNIFCLGYNLGFHFGTGSLTGYTGSTSKFKIVNADCDMCWKGIYIDGQYTTGQISNFTCQGSNDQSPGTGLPAMNWGYNGIDVEAANVRLHATNVRTTSTYYNGIDINGSGTFAAFENTFVESWNASGYNYPAIASGGGAVVNVGFGCCFFSPYNNTSTGAAPTPYLNHDSGSIINLDGSSVTANGYVVH